MTQVLFMVPLPPPITGQSLACRSFLDALTMTPGVDVDVIDTMKGSLGSRLPGPVHFLRMLKFAWRGRRLGRTADVIYMNPSQSVLGNLKDLMLYWIMGPKNVGKVVLHLHGGGIRKTVYDRCRFLAWLNRRQLSRMRGLVVLGERLRHVFEGMTQDDRIHVVPNFAPDDLFLDPTEIETKFASLDPIEVLYLSNFNPEKGCFELLAAAEALHARGADGLRFTFAGGFEEPTQEAEIRARIDALPNAELLGVIEGEERRRALARAHVLALPSYYPYEGQPLCLIEAMASGCVLMTSDQGGIPDVFQAGINGYEVQKRSQASIEAVLLQLLDEREGLGAIASRNREHAECYREARYHEGLLKLCTWSGRKPLSPH
ncbi:MAG: glycosyltransferase family 4 protein [Planctomycetota bacterium]|nr:glycosyltransferase family 4 protein [Planctomycetota bacterium]